MAHKQSDRELRTRQRGFDAIYLMRSRGYSRTRAAREAHIDPRTLQKHFSSVLAQDASGRYQARSGDNLVAYMCHLTREGIRIGAVRGSRNRALLAEHAAAVDHLLRTGDYSRLRKFRGKAVRIDGKLEPLLTDKRVLKDLGDAGETSYIELYALA